MKIEDVTASALRDASDRDLRDVRFRFVQLHDRYFSDPAVTRKGDLSKGECLRRYVLLRREMTRRGMALNSSTSIDRDIEGRIAKKALLDLDVPGLDEVVLAESVVVVTGPFLANPKKAESVDLTIMKIARSRELEERIAAIVRSETGKAATFSYGAEEPAVSHVPLYDLVLRPRPATERVSVRTSKSAGEAAAPATISDFDIAASLERARLASEEWALIAANRKTQEGRMRHKFVEARFAVSYDGGRPLCLVCGAQEPIGGLCPGDSATWKETKDATERPAAMTADLSKKKGDRIGSLCRFEIVKIDEAERIVGGVIYEPGVEDTQGDFTDREEIRKAMFKFMEGYFKQQARIKVMHKGKPYEFPILECFQPETDILKGGKTVRAGSWWLMIRVEDDIVWGDVSTGALTGFSMGGRATTEG